MHIVRIAAFGLLAIGALVGLGFLLAIGVMFLADSPPSGRTFGLRVILSGFIAFVCAASGASVLNFQPRSLSTSAFAVALLALVAFALDYYDHGKIYLTGDFGPIAASMLLCACLLAASRAEYEHARSMQSETK